ncbi:NADase-type glycan-binding domain-containing protein [Anaeromicrobium sediminis]|uniref:NAD glycohydrolase translocation F5/8 type C domain-containing protein n=1 Tax=Anaeromicrobium sediminis TaxID=1478221 RepID=A0A267ML57_9FIRM|nr:hypothetical protein [Anaeromicrobium sediminis]PAB59648.1 hypothetical protein CCE28_08765 [Anaeromicrobium sediminis]
MARRLILLILFIILIPVGVYANGAPVDTGTYTVTGNVEPIEKKDISIEREHIKLRVDEDYVNVKVTYDFLNMGGAQDFKYAFPVDYKINEYESQLKETIFNFKMYDGDEELKILDVKVEKEVVQRDENLYEDVNINVDNEVRKWFITSLTFDENEKKTVYIEYKIKTLYVDWGMSNEFFTRFDKNYFEYNLTPAKVLGEGIIKDFNLEIDVKPLIYKDGDVDYLNVDDFVYEEGIYKVNRENLNIDEMPNIKLAYNSIRHKEKKELENTRIDEEFIKNITSSSHLEGYGVENLYDKDLDTTWAIKEDWDKWIQIEFKYPIEVSLVGIINGYTKDKTVYEENKKVKAFKLELYNGKNKITEEIRYIQERNYEDLDKEYYKDFIDYSDFVYAGPEVDKIKITILDTYDGLLYEDLCISEILLLSNTMKNKNLIELIKLYYKEEKTNEEKRRLLNLLMEVKSHELYESAYFNYNDVIKELSNIELKTEKDFRNIIELGNKKENISKTIYGQLIKSIFFSEPKKFIKELSKYPNKIESTALYMSDEISGKEEWDRLKDEIKELNKDKELKFEETVAVNLFYIKVNENIDKL